MERRFQRLCTVLGLAVALTMMLTFAPPVSSPGVRADLGPAPPTPANGKAVTTGAALHNAGLDNNDWYEFDRRYQGAYPAGAWLPDDDNNGDNALPDSTRQDWRLWFQDGTVPIRTGSTDSLDPSLARDVEAVWAATYWDGKHLAGLYQPIHNTIPCATYEFQMYGQSRPQSGDSLVALQVGIDRVGWHPPSSTDPAVHAYPDTTVFGPSHQYTWSYGPLTVTAEALDTSITIFTYADANGGSSNLILWDTASLVESTTSLIADPDNPPSASGVSSLSAGTSSTSASISWYTSAEASGQIYYRLISTASGTVTSTTTFSPTVFIPFASRPPSQWVSTSLNTTPVAYHYEIVGGLKPASTYEYIVASRGVSGNQCVTWVSNKETFTTVP